MNINELLMLFRLHGNIRINQSKASELAVDCWYRGKDVVSVIRLSS